MAKRVELDGLTPEESNAAKLRAQGLSQVESYRRAFDVKRMKPKTVYEKSSKLFAKPAMQTRVEALLRDAKVEDLDSIGQAVDDLLQLITKCVEEGNLTAAANLMRQRLQVHGALRDRLLITPEEQASDADLIERLAGDDPAKAAALRQVLGAKEGFDLTRH